jgi:hypothetical protein
MAINLKVNLNKNIIQIHSWLLIISISPLMLISNPSSFTEDIDINFTDNENIDTCSEYYPNPHHVVLVNKSRMRKIRGLSLPHDPSGQSNPQHKPFAKPCNLQLSNCLD